MAYTTPATVTAGQVLTASYLNTYVRDNMSWALTDSPTCRAYNTALQAINNNSLTAVTYNSERFDNAAMHSTSSNTSRITAPTGGGGKYLFGAVMEWASNGTGTRQIVITLNGTTDIAYNSNPGDSTGGGVTTVGCVTATYALAAADYIENRAYQDSGGVLNIVVASGRPQEFWASWYRV